ncbi:MAG TPA: NAD synthetase [Planctomycetes bacterium]|nr:NAD synthetase [Planctomycetota bacterium]
MDDILHRALEFVVIVIFMAGFAQFRTPAGARCGNLTAAAAMIMAAAVVVLRESIDGWPVIAAALIAGGGLGWAIAAGITMRQIPAMIAFQHGAGGVAAFLVSAAELAREPASGLSVGKAAGLLGIALGAATFAGSLVAGGKLAGVLKGTPTVLPRHGAITGATLAVLVVLGAAVGLSGPGAVVWGSIALIAVSMWLGVAAAIRIGGADMPVLISFLNAAAGLAAAFCGVIIKSQLLIACGATVAASGSILTHVMCKAMHRNLRRVFLGFAPAGPAPRWLPDDSSGGAGAEAARPEAASGAGTAGAPAETPAPAPAAIDPLAEAVALARAAARVIIVPGYGMALAQAQFQTVQLANALEARGAEVWFAIHPVAGRMPGHMNVLLAEADVSYDKLIELDEANRRLEDADLALVVGACDVVNPAAVQTEGTPISGMPIIDAGAARHVLVCNLDARPGYSGVENLLYARPNAVLLFGDAARTLERIIEGVKA